MGSALTWFAQLWSPGIDVLMRKLSLGGFVRICWWYGWSVEWWWVGFCQFVGGCLGLLGCEIWRLKFHFTRFEFNFLGFKFAGFAFLFKYIMCSCLIYLFYLGFFFFFFFHVDFIIFLGLWVWFVGGFGEGKGFWMNFCMFICWENVIKEKKILIILIFWATFMFFPEEHEEYVTLFFRK